MGPQFLLWGVGRSYTWDIFLERLRRGEPDAYLILIGISLGIAVALWAGANMMRKERRR